VLYRRRVVQIPLGDSGSVRARLDRVQSVLLEAIH